MRLSSFSGSNSHASASFGFYEHIARKEIADIKMVELCCSPLGYKVVGKDRLFLFLTAGNLKKKKKERKRKICCLVAHKKKRRRRRPAREGRNYRSCGILQTKKAKRI